MTLGGAAIGGAVMTGAMGVLSDYGVITDLHEMHEHARSQHTGARAHKTCVSIARGWGIFEPGNSEVKWLAVIGAHLTT